MNEAIIIKFYSYCERVCQKGPPPGSQAYKIYVRSNRVKGQPPTRVNSCHSFYDIPLILSNKLTWNTEGFG